MITKLILVASWNHMAREVATSSLLVDLPEALVIQHDLAPEGHLTRRSWEATKTHDEHSLTLGHGCVSCATREDLVPALAQALDERAWRTIIVSLPLSATPEPVVWQLNEAIRDGLAAEIATVLTVIDETRLVFDVFGDQLLADQGLALSELDERSVGEAACAQLDFADVIATLDTPDELTTAVLDHLTGQRHRSQIHSLDAPALLANRHDFTSAQARTDPTRCPHYATADCCGVWTLVLTSDRPLHPGRLYAQVELIGAGRLRSKGLTWVPSRPETVVAWDGAGGQLSIGDAGLWARKEHRHTRIVITGIDEADRGRVQRAFRDILLTDWEHARIDHWDCDDGLELWLGRPD